MLYKFKLVFEIFRAGEDRPVLSRMVYSLAQEPRDIYPFLCSLLRI